MGDLKIELLLYITQNPEIRDFDLIVCCCECGLAGNPAIFSKLIRNGVLRCIADARDQKFDISAADIVNTFD